MNQERMMQKSGHPEQIKFAYKGIVIRQEEHQVIIFPLGTGIVKNKLDYYGTIRNGNLYVTVIVTHWIEKLIRLIY